MLRLGKWALAIVLIGLFLVVDWRLANPPPCIDRYAQQQEINEYSPVDKCPTYGGLIFANLHSLTVWAASNEKEILSLSTLGIMFFTIVLALSTTLLWKAGERHAERQLRAYISVTPTTGRRFALGQVPEIDFIVENAGQTPAYRLRYIATVDIFEHPLVDHQGDLLEIDPASKIPTRAVHPGSHIKGSASLERPLTKDDMEKISEGTKYCLYLAGIAIYEDAFGIERRTKFCAFVEGRVIQKVLRLARVALQRGEIPKVEMDWTFSHVHNEAT